MSSMSVVSVACDWSLDDLFSVTGLFVISYFSVIGLSVICEWFRTFL